MKPILHLICAARASLLSLGLMLFCVGGSAQTQDTSGLGLRLTQSITHITDMTAITSARIVSMDYGSATVSNLVDTVTSEANPASDPRITAQTQSYGDGAYTIPEIETSARANLLPQQTSLIARIRSAAASARVSGAVWVFNQTVRPTGATRPMKITWYLMLAPGGRVITSEPKVVEEDPTVVYMTYYSKAVGKSLPASYAWAEAGLLKWQLRRYDGSPVTDWTTVDTSGAYDSTESDSEVGPRCLATAQTIAGCVQGYATARTLMTQTASRKALMDYVRAVDVSYTPGSGGYSTPDIKIAFDVRQYTRISCTAGSYRCAGSVGYTVVEAMDRYSMTDTEALPTKVNSIKGLNSSRPSATFDVSVGVSDKPAVIDPFVINPFDQPLALIAQTAMPGITRMATLQVDMPPTAGEFTCLAGEKVVGNQCVSTFSTPANETFICLNGGIPSGNTCTSTTTTSATPNTTYSCLSGGERSGTTCTLPGRSYKATATTNYSCLNGSPPNGTTCTSTTTTSATPNTTYSCLSGGTRSGTTCTITTTTTAQSGNVSATTSASDMTVGAGTPGFIEFGTIGNNYWGGGQYDRTMSFNIDNVSAVNEFKLVRAMFDDWVSLTVNGVFIGVAPHAGDRLELTSRSVSYCDEFSCYSYLEPVVRHGANAFMPVELGKSWDVPYDIDLRPYLRSGSNNILVRTIVGGWGESWLQFRASINNCPSRSNFVAGQCVSSSSYPATPTVVYTCADGSPPSNSTCSSTTTTSATPNTTYSCLSGGERSGTICNVPSSSYSATPSTSYSCTKGVVSGNQCIRTNISSATPSYSCDSGDLIGSNCLTQTSAPASWVPLTCPD